MKPSGILICHWVGRFGNRMHTYAYAAQYSRTFGIDLLLPSEWEGTHLFKHDRFQIVDDDELRLLLNQSQPGLDTLEARSRAVEAHNQREGSSFEYLNPDLPHESWAGKRAVFIDSLCAYHPTIFQHISREYLRNEVFVFSDEVRNTDFFRHYSDRQGTYDVAHLRRDDIANPSFNQNIIPGTCMIPIQ